MTTLTIKSLIEILSAYPQDQPVFLEVDDDSRIRTNGIGTIEARPQHGSDPAGVYIVENGI